MYFTTPPTNSWMFFLCFCVVHVTFVTLHRVKYLLNISRSWFLNDVSLHFFSVKLFEETTKHEALPVKILRKWTNVAPGKGSHVPFQKNFQANMFQG